MGQFKILLFFIGLCLLISGVNASTLEVGSGKTYSTINNALSAASSGDTVLVYPGTYNERLDIKNIHDLVIQGVGLPTITNADPQAHGTISIGGGTYDLPENAYNITIKGLHIVNTGSTFWWDAGIRNFYSYTHGITIEDNIIDTYMGNGILFGGIGLSTKYYDTCNDTRIINNTITVSGSGAGLMVSCNPVNLTITDNDISVVDPSYIAGDPSINETTGAYGLCISPDTSYNRAKNVDVERNIVRRSGYSLIKVYALNATVKDNIAYGNALHNCYELGFVGGYFYNNTLINATKTWANIQPTRFNSLNNFYNPGITVDSNEVFEDVHAIGSTYDRMISIGGHQTKIVVKNTTIDASSNPDAVVIIYGFSSTGIPFRSSDKLLFDNFTVSSHNHSGTPAMFIQGAGTDSTPSGHTVGNYADLKRDNITFYNCKVLNDSTYGLGLYADSADTNVSVILANSNITTGYSMIYGGGVVSSIDRCYYTDIDVTDIGSPAGKCRIFVTSNTTRRNYNEYVPHFSGNYVDNTQQNYTYQQTAKGMLDTPEYIETLDDGTTGTRATPSNCLLLASTTEGLASFTGSSTKVVNDVYYNLTVSGGDFNSNYLYTTPTGTSDIITIDSQGNYEHKYGTKHGSSSNYHPLSAQYKVDPYERGTVDITIPITDYDKTIIPLGVNL